MEDIAKLVALVTSEIWEDALEFLVDDIPETVQ